MNTIEADFEGCYMPQDPRWIGYEEMDNMMNGYRIWAYIFDECGGGARRRLRLNVQHRLLLRRSEKASPRVILASLWPPLHTASFVNAPLSIVVLSRFSSVVVFDSS